VCFKGLTDKETAHLTQSFVESGDVLDFSSISDYIADKHSTGGVGDKTTIIIGPIVASLGVKVAKMSGRGLGHTGGTIDKLESIPGFRSNLSKEEFINQVKKIGFADVCQSNELAPADKKIYALRDVTGTVECIPLIASSIMSKKIAGGSKKLVIDVKVGSGALVKDISSATHLANLMINIGAFNNMEVVCLLTNMNIPLGSNIGNTLEIEEAIDILKNHKKGRLTDICIELATYMVSLGLNIDYKSAKDSVIEVLDNGLAYRKFLEFVESQGGDITALPKGDIKRDVLSPKDGYITNIDALKLGLLSLKLGSGRTTMDDVIDPTAGIVLNKDINDYVKKGDILMTVYTKKNIDDISSDMFTIQDKKSASVDLILKVMR